MKSASIKNAESQLRRAWRDQAANSSAEDDYWLFHQSIMRWMGDPSLRSQLPLPYRLLTLYFRLHRRLSSQQHVAGAYQIFKLAARLNRLLSQPDYVQLEVGSRKVYVNLQDPRFIQVVREVQGGSSDANTPLPFLSEGDTFVDVGANHGTFSILASERLGKDGLLVAVEPQPHLADLVRKSLAANASCAFQVHQVAVGDRNGNIDLLIPRGSSGSALVSAHQVPMQTSRRINVPLRRFDELVNWKEFPGHVFVKVDVEGSEYAFLRGARQMIATQKPTLMIEFHPERLRSGNVLGDKVRDLLMELGYSQFSNTDELAKTYSLETLDVEGSHSIICHPS